MKKILLTAFLVATMATSVVAADTTKKNVEKQKAAKQFNLSTLTCGEFIEMSAPEALTTLSWIDGYLTYKTGTPVWDVETFVQHRDKLIKICVDETGKDKLVIEEIQNLD